MCYSVKSVLGMECLVAACKILIGVSWMEWNWIESLLLLYRVFASAAGALIWAQQRILRQRVFVSPWTTMTVKEAERGFGIDFMKQWGCELCFKGRTLNTLLRSWCCRHWDPIEDCSGALCCVVFGNGYEMVWIGRRRDRI